MAAQRNDTPYEPNLIDSLSGRVAGGVTSAGRWLVRNVIPAAWFGPGQPLAPVAQDQAAGRRWDYPTGQNLRFTPRSAEPISFAQLRGLADSHDLVRLLIETRKDQLCKLAWNIQPRDGTGPDSRCKKIQDFLAYPDLIHPWQTWLRILLEDLLVLDAPCVYPVRTRGGGVYSLDVIDGSTISPVIDFYGRTPDPPSPAFQQVIHGLPAVDYARDELVYWPRNPRPHKVYGYGVVESIVMTVNIALRRQIKQLYSFTEGNIPEALIGVPVEWTPSQIGEFQAYWDSLLEGNLAQKSHAKFVPGGVNIHEIQAGELFGHAEEWLARVICFAFSVSPQPFVKEQNRATAQTQKESAEEEGIEPYRQWVKGLMDYVIARHFGMPDLEFDWQQDEDTDPLVQAQVDQIYLAAGVYSPEYVADRLGVDPKWMPEEPEPAAAAPGGPEPSEKIEKAKKKALKPIARNRKEIADAVEPLAWVLQEAFAKAARRCAEAVSGFGKTDAYEETLLPGQAQAAMRELDLVGWAAVAGPASAWIEAAAKAGAKAAAAQLKIKAGGDDDIFGRANGRAVDYARDRGAELVGKRILADGSLADNPDAKWAITGTTRDKLRALVETAEAEGWSATRLARGIMEADAFSGERAMMIARTECGNADIQGAVALYRESGRVGRKEWVTAHDDLVSPECRENGAAGIIEFDKPFPSGAMWPLQHPRCRCSLAPILIDEE